MYKYVHTHSFFMQTPNHSFKRWENAISGHTAEATNLQNTEWLCFEFLGIFKLLSDTILFVNLHPFRGRGPKCL